MNSARLSSAASASTHVLPGRLASAHIPLQTTGVVVIDLAALARNYSRLSQIAKTAETAAVIKADAYGLGSRDVLQALQTKTTCRTIFVATLTEAIALGSTFGIKKYVLDGLLPGTAESFVKVGAIPVLGSLAEINEWGEFCAAAGKPHAAAIHVDTGMTRLGLSVDEASHLAKAPEKMASFNVPLIMSHLACADQPGHPKNTEQLALFHQVADGFAQTPKSLANSAGLLLGTDFHFNMVRPGIALYGGRSQNTAENLTEAVVWVYGRIAQVRWAERGETVGYGAKRTLKRRTKIVTVAAGYADGYVRAASSTDNRDGPCGYFGDYALPLLGRVSMDLTMFDATDVPNDQVERGGWVELLGERVTVDDLAGFANTIGYEILTSLSRRFHRVYIND